MKQILQNLKNGTTELVDVPEPGQGRGQVLIASRRSLVSAGTSGQQPFDFLSLKKGQKHA